MDLHVRFCTACVFFHCNFSYSKHVCPCSGRKVQQGCFVICALLLTYENRKLSNHKKTKTNVIIWCNKMKAWSFIILYHCIPKVALHDEISIRYRLSSTISDWHFWFFVHYISDQLSCREFIPPLLFTKPIRPNDCVTSSTLFSHDPIIWHCHSNSAFHTRRNWHHWKLPRLCDHK